MPSHFIARLSLVLLWLWTTAGTAAETAAAPSPAKDSELSPLLVPGTTTIDTETAKSLYDEKVIFIDVRGDGYWNKGHITGAVHLQMPDQFTPDKLEQRVKPDQPLVLYCQGVRCWRSHDAAKRALAWGFKQIYYYREGFPAWQTAGYPVTIPPTQ